MSFEFNLMLTCDSCGVEENYGEDFEVGEDLTPPKIPDGWEEDFDDGASIFKHVCEDCIESFKEEDERLRAKRRKERRKPSG